MFSANKTQEAVKEVGLNDVSKEKLVLVETHASENKKKSRADNEKDSESGAIRVKLPTALSQKLKETLAELKSRGANLSAEELLADYFEELPEKYLKGQLMKKTPGDYYLNAVLEIPEVRAKLLRQAKRALHFHRSSDGTSGGKRSRKMRESTGSAVSDAGMEHVSNGA